MSVSSLSALSSLGSAATPQDLTWRLRVEQYHTMIRAGILTADDPVELLEGWLVYKIPKNPPHRVATGLAQTALERILPMGWCKCFFLIHPQQLCGRRPAIVNAKPCSPGCEKLS